MVIFEEIFKNIAWVSEQTPKPDTKKEWPFWAKSLKTLAKSEDKGIGDVVARLIGDENSEQFKSWYKATFNKDCGCKGRQARWNRLYPLK